MFCTTLRRRASFSSAVPSLIAPTGLGLRESHLETHDLIIPIASEVDHQTGKTFAKRELRVLLFSPNAVAEAKLDDTLRRIQRFASLTASRELAIVFLLSPPPSSSFVSAKQVANSKPEANDSRLAGTDALATLQIKLMERSDIPYIPILPTATLESLPSTLRKHVASLTRIQRPSHRKPAPTSLHLLRLCTASPPMPQQTAYYLSDLFPDLRALAEACTNVSSAPTSSSPSARAAGVSSQVNDVLMTGTQMTGTQMTDDTAQGMLKKLKDLVGERQCVDVVEFWREEWAVE